MPHELLDTDIAAFANLPPPPYSEGIDLTPTPQSVNRPRLPARRNPYLQTPSDDLLLVKFQTIVREDREIIIGRIKVPIPAAAGAANQSPHAFILRRYDTDSISLTTMFKCAFPDASDADEKREMEWVRSSYDTRGTNGGRDCDAVRLAGQWISRHLAIHLAGAYGLSPLILALARAVPDPSVAYRKSQRSQAAADELAQRQPTSSTAASPARRPAPSMTTTDAAQPTPKRRRAEQGERQVTLEATTTVTAPAGTNIDMESEIESAKQLVRDLRRELQLRAAAGDALEEMGGQEAESSRRGTKRGAEEDDGTAISGGMKKGEERLIRSNRRVQGDGGAVGAVKRVAFGAMLFGLGASAALFLPSLAAQYL